MATREMWERQQEKKRRERKRKARIRRNRITALTVLAALIVLGAVGVRKYMSGGDIAVTGGAELESIAEATTAPAETLSPTPTAGADITLSESYYKSSVFIGNAIADGIGMYGVLPESGVYAKVGLAIAEVYSTAADNDTVAIIDQLKSKKYSKVFLAFGESELMSGDLSSFKSDYEELVAAVKEYQSSARIYLMAIPPISETASASYGITLTRLKSFNSAIRSVASSMSVYYSDCYTALANENGYLDEGISADGINLNKTAYLNMLDYITKHSLIPGDDDEDYEYEDDEEDTDEDDEESNTEDDEVSDKSSAKSSSGSSGKTSSTDPTPKPTTNVLKESQISKGN